ncbi:MAG: diguanylate cyclase [Cyanobacteria bacterium P01_A01_bin.45]
MNFLKILIVEDEQNIATDIRSNLQKLGYSVAPITDFEKEIINPVSKKFPALTMINIALGGKFNSLKIADIIQELCHASILYVIDNLEEIKIHHCHNREGFNYLFKSVLEKNLDTTVQMPLYKQTVKKKWEQETQWLETVIESMNCAVLVTDVNSSVRMMNPLAEKITGWNFKSAFGEDFSTIFNLIDEETGEDIDNIATQVISTGKALTLPNSSILITKNGEKIPVGDSISPIRDRNNQIIGSVLIFQDITQRKKMEAQLTRNAFYDSLTDLPNRILFLDRLRQAFQRSKRRSNYRFAVLFLDLDGFKEINDHFGHTVGDDFLVAISRRLEFCLRSSDTIARFGGDEFAILLEEIKDVSIATNVAQRIQQALSLPLDLNTHQTVTSASIGIVVNTSEYEEPEKLLRDADIAMYCSKQKGKATYTVFKNQHLT